MIRLDQSREPNQYRKRGMFLARPIGDKIPPLVKVDNFNPDVLGTERPIGVFFILWYIKNEDGSK